MKGLRLSTVSGWITGSNLSLLTQLSLFPKWFLQKGSQLRPSLSNNHCGFLCHVTLFVVKLFYWWHTVSLIDKLYLWSNAIFAMGNLVNIQKHSKTKSGGCFIYLYLILSHLKFWSGKCIMAAIFEPLFTKLKPTIYKSQHWASGSAKAETETFCKIHKGWAHGLK